MLEPVIFPLTGSHGFTGRLAKKLPKAFLWSVESKRFGDSRDGEAYYRFEVVSHNSLLGRDVILVGSTHNDESEEMLYRLGCAAVGNGARRLICVVPFLGYSTMERAVKPGEVVTAKTVARKLSSIPQAPLGNYFLFMDLHVSGLLHYFEGDCKRFELYGENVLEEAIKKLQLDSMIFGSADLGRPTWVKTFARKFNTRIVVVDKDREGERTEIFNVIGDVQNENVVIYDDMTRSGKTLIQAANAYKARGAKSVSAVLSHGAFNNRNVIRNLNESCIENIIITNTHPMSEHPFVTESKKFHVVDVSPVFADAVKKILG